MNFGLQGERQQEAIVAGYAAFLNGLTFPVQILVRVLPIDLERYLAELERRAAARGCRSTLAELARDHVAFLRRLARNRTLLERRFYVVVPADGASAARSPPRLAASAAGAARRSTPRRGAAAAHRPLRGGRPPAGPLRADAPGAWASAELAQLYHACWCPELARVAAPAPRAGRVHRAGRAGRPAPARGRP